MPAISSANRQLCPPPQSPNCARSQVGSVHPRDRYCHPARAPHIPTALRWAAARPPSDSSCPHLPRKHPPPGNHPHYKLHRRHNLKLNTTRTHTLPVLDIAHFLFIDPETIQGHLVHRLFVVVPFLTAHGESAGRHIAHRHLVQRARPHSAQLSVRRRHIRVQRRCWARCWRGRNRSWTWLCRRSLCHCGGTEVFMTVTMTPPAAGLIVDPCRFRCGLAAAIKNGADAEYQQQQHGQSPNPPGPRRQQPPQPRPIRPGTTGRNRP